MSPKAIERLAHQLYATRVALHQFQATEKTLSAKLRPHLQLGQRLTLAGIDLELIPVQAHTVPTYEVPEYTKITVTPSDSVVSQPEARA